nr:MAG TPA: hypothetical protein [Bacteriophage sp.]
MLKNKHLLQNIQKQCNVNYRQRKSIIVLVNGGVIDIWQIQ